LKDWPGLRDLPKAASRAAEKTSEQSGQAEYQKNEKADPGDSGCGNNDSSEAHYRSQHGDREKAQR
jgi:hypothetical protein